MGANEGLRSEVRLLVKAASKPNAKIAPKHASKELSEHCVDANLRKAHGPVNAKPPQAFQAHVQQQSEVVKPQIASLKFALPLDATTMEDEEMEEDAAIPEAVAMEAAALVAVVATNAVGMCPFQPAMLAMPPLTSASTTSLRHSSLPMACRLMMSTCRLRHQRK